jgi:general secretion pathway protein B
MSYILEALKKSQADRQLGSAPTLHAVPLGAAPADAAARKRWPLWLALAGGVLAVALGVMAWRAQAPAVRPSAPRLAVVAPPAPAVVAPAVPPATPPAVARTPAPPLAVLPPSAPEPKPAAAHVAPQPAPVKASAPMPAAAPAPAPAPEGERLPLLRELPEAIQRAVPPLAFGGYMYSNNPADRLILIDKTLRHEGEEVAPGLVLEKLLPKAAVMNYKGNRYRVPY